MRKRERENPCGICGHYHKYELGEVCGVCGHRPPASSSSSATAAAGVAVQAAPRQDSAFPSEILKDFLFLGSYDNASRSELLKTIGISHILNTVPLCQNLYRNSFTYHCLQDEKTLQFDDAIQFLEQCERDKARVLVHCMSGKSRFFMSLHPIYLMLLKHIYQISSICDSLLDEDQRLETCPVFSVGERKETTTAQRQLIEYEQKLLNSTVGIPAQAFGPTDSFPSLGFGFPKPSGDIQVPIFNQQAPASIFERVSPHNIPSNFTFGAERTTEVKLPDNNSFGVVNSSGGDSMMDSS
uniref:Tyrosine-protein phosphatase domain-containing protein n=1 Tax=Oryza punctata TaxID=4537 RepID=A0A0E0LAW1_ORYPU